MKFAFAFAALLLLAAGFTLTAVEPAGAQCVGPCGAVPGARAHSDPLRRLIVRPGPVPMAPAEPAAQWRRGLRGSASLRSGRLWRDGVRLFPETHLCLLEAAGLHRLLSRPRQLLLAQGLLVRFVWPPLLQLRLG